MMLESVADPGLLNGAPLRGQGGVCRESFSMDVQRVIATT